MISVVFSQAEMCFKHYDSVNIKCLISINDFYNTIISSSLPHYSNQSDILMSLSVDKDAEIIEAFNSTSMTC